MQKLNMLATTVLALLALAACSGIEVEQADTERFAAGNYQFYTWRTRPLPNSGGSADPIYKIDPMVRASVDRQLRDKGFMRDAARAQFAVDYQFAQGLMEGAKSELAHSITPLPGRMNRNPNQAQVDNAFALAGMKTTADFAIRFYDLATGAPIWQVVASKIVDDANAAPEKIHKDIDAVVKRAFRGLPPAA